MTKPAIPEPGSMSWPFRLGDEVKDKISGLSGVATSRSFHMTGCDRFAFELPAADGKLGEIIHLDGNRLELVTAHPSRWRFAEVPEDLHVKLGDEVKSMISGISGTATIIHVPLFGATQVCIEPKWDTKEKKMPDGFLIDATFVEIIKAYTPLPKDAPKPEPGEQTKSERGACRMPANFTGR